MSTQTQNRPLTSASVRSIMTNRQPVKTDDVDETVILRIQGDGNVIDVKDKAGNLVMSSIKGQEGVVLQKKIFNCKAVSHLAQQNPRTRQFMTDGLAAEKAGKGAEASELFNQYLNATQLSFGVLLPSAKADLLRDGVKISADIIQVTTENGSLLTIDPSTISVQAAKKLEASTSFNIADFEVAPTAPANETAAQKRARLAVAK